MLKSFLLTDPLQEKKYEVLPGLIWKYPNRVLLITTGQCPLNCPFCFRQKLYKKDFKRAKDEVIVKFVKKHKEIKEFIFSGGEPLMVIEDVYNLVKKLSSIKQLKVFRIHTRFPILSPNKVKIKILKKIIKTTTNPWYLVLHVNTPKELENIQTRQTIGEIRRLGFILLSHTVFLKDINDNVEILEKLFSQLIEMGVKPYYIFHCDNMTHTQKYIVPLKKEIEIVTALRKKLSGIANPTHVVDSISGYGKIPVPLNFWQFNPRSYKDFSSFKNNL